MMKRMIALLTLGMILTTGFMIQPKAEAAAPATLKLGSVSQDVPDLEYRLQILGYYPTTISTKFTISTQVAVRHFQRDNRLSVNGIVGPTTWAKLKSMTVNKPELTMIARTIYGEARGESYTGQVAVGAVIMNRLQSPLFPSTLKGVIMEPLAFTAVSDGQYWLIPNKTAFQAARQAVRGYDPTKNALYYYNPKTATSTWMQNRPVTTVIGEHVFTK